VRDGKVVLFVNLGDHAKVGEAFAKEIAGYKEAAEMHTDWNESARFIQKAVTGDVKGLHVFLHEDTFAAVYTTNLLMRASDILMTKPSELAFYPIPKLFLQRVGGHEAWGAIRGAELGDGTVECTSAALAHQALDMLINEDDLLTQYCENIIKLNSTGIYRGAYRVIELAMERKNR